MRPITPQPGYTSADLVALLATKQFVYIECYTITNKDGISIRYTTSQRSVEILLPVPGGGGQLYTSTGAKVSGIVVETGVGVEVDEQSIRFDYDPEELYQGIPYASALRYGRFDGGIVRRDRYFGPDFGEWVGGVPMFVGRVSSVDRISRSSAEMKVKSDLVLLKTQMPRKLMQPSCLHTLFDPGCTLNKIDFEQAGVVGAGSTASVINWAGATPDLTLGSIQIEDVVGVTLVRSIERATETQLFLSNPLESVPEPGTNFSAYPGCVRSYARCGEFGNQANFQGFPFVPVAETAY